MPSINTSASAVAPAKLVTRLPVVYPRVSEEDAVIMGVDPGGSDDKDETGHVGIALACRYLVDSTPHTGQPTWVHQTPGWRVYDTAELTPDEFIRWFASNTSGIDVVFGEMFRLEKKRAMAQVGSMMPTSQLIGWIRMHCMLYAPHIDVNWQSNMVLSGPTAALLRDHNIRPVSPPGKNAARGSTGDHQRSAELHLWHGLIRAGLVDGISSDIG